MLDCKLSFINIIECVTGSSYRYVSLKASVQEDVLGFIEGRGRFEIQIAAPKDACPISFLVRNTAHGLLGHLLSRCFLKGRQEGKNCEEGDAIVSSGAVRSSACQRHTKCDASHCLTARFSLQKSTCLHPMYLAAGS